MHKINNCRPGNEHSKRKEISHHTSLETFASSLWGHKALPTMWRKNRNHKNLFKKGLTWLTNKDPHYKRGDEGKERLISSRPGFLSVSGS